MTDLTQPSCLWPLAGGHTAEGPAEGQTHSPQASAAGPTGTSGGARRPLRPPDTEWQAGGLACGDLLLLLRATMNKLPPRSVLRLVATDAGAAEDIPAWCRLTGHQLLWAQHPEFFIQRRD